MPSPVPSLCKPQGHGSPLGAGFYSVAPAVVRWSLVLLRGFSFGPFFSWSIPRISALSSQNKPLRAHRRPCGQECPFLSGEVTDHLIESCSDFSSVTFWSADTYIQEAGRLKTASQDLPCLFPRFSALERQSRSLGDKKSEGWNVCHWLLFSLRACHSPGHFTATL